MHVKIIDQQNNECRGIICIERDAGTSIILLSRPDTIDQLVAIARAMKVGRVLMLTQGGVPEGWKVSHAILVQKDLTNGT